MRSWNFYGLSGQQALGLSRRAVSWTQGPEPFGGDRHGWGLGLLLHRRGLRGQRRLVRQHHHQVHRPGGHGVSLGRRHVLGPTEVWARPGLVSDTLDGLWSSGRCRPQGAPVPCPALILTGLLWRAQHVVGGVTNERGGGGGGAVRPQPPLDRRGVEVGGGWQRMGCREAAAVGRGAVAADAVGISWEYSWPGNCLSEM